MLSHFTETPRLEKPYPRRPFPAAPDMLVSSRALTGLVVVFFGLPFNLLLTIKWLRHLETLSKPSMAAIFLSYLVDVYPGFILFPIIANFLNMAFGSRYQMGQIFIWGVLQYCVLYFPGALFMIVWNFSLRRYAYSAWLSTFDEDWMEKNEYALWWKLISVGLRLSNALEKFSEWLSPLNSFEKWFWTSKQERIELELAEQEKKRKLMEDMEFDDVVISKLLK